MGFSCRRRGRPVGYVALALAKLQGGAVQPRIAPDFNDDYAALAVPDEDGGRKGRSTNNALNFLAAAADRRPPVPSPRGGRGGGRGGAAVGVPRAGGDGYGPQKHNGRSTELFASSFVAFLFSRGLGARSTLP